MSNSSDLGKEIEALLRGQATEFGLELVSDSAGLATEIAESVDRLALASGEPGYDLAVEAEIDNIALLAGITAVERADAADKRLLSLLQGAIVIAARAVIIA